MKVSIFCQCRRGPGITYRNATLLCPTVGPDNTTPQPQKSLPQNGSSLEMPYDGRVRLSKTKKQASPVYPASGTWMLVKFMSNNKIIDNQMNYAGHSGDKESVPLLSLNFVLQSASKQEFGLNLQHTRRILRRSMIKACPADLLPEMENQFLFIGKQSRVSGSGLGTSHKTQGRQCKSEKRHSTNKKLKDWLEEIIQ
ncbi:hypothetical protein MG293_001811 [Ovis ammon polii]|uniref:Uncharacterized protein n=1 Tax=Ovis ammon polii TaxID=230172 RepID=A0AAD4UQ55_OVIAM|nr:hypothetical protein MG293_001811 [Ovis ammon polii]